MGHSIIGFRHINRALPVYLLIHDNIKRSLHTNGTQERIMIRDERVVGYLKPQPP